MRIRVATAVGITAAVLTLPACSPAPSPQPAATTPALRTQHQGDTKATALSSAALEARLLTQHDLGDSYLPKPVGHAEHGDVTVLGCPALDELGGEAATGGSLSFPRQAETAFTYRGSDAELSEELYSDTPAKLSTGTGRIFDAMTGCRTYQVLIGSTAVDVTV